MLNQKTALITGASSGIGKELTYLFARDGYRLVLSALNHAKVEGFGMLISEEYKVPVEIISADLSTMDGPRQLYDEVKNRKITIDVLVNNAGVGMYGDFTDVDMDEYMKIINVNIISFTHIAKLFVPDIIERKGKILNTASIAAYQPGPHMSVYYASKAYDLSMSLALSEELAQYGVTVTALCPGPTVTNFQVRAKQEHTRAFQNKLLTMKPKDVAEIGYEAMKNGKRVVIAGAKNKLTMSMERFMSQKAVTKLSQLYLTVTGKKVIDKNKELELQDKTQETVQDLRHKQDKKRSEMGSVIESRLHTKDTVQVKEWSSADSKKTRSRKNDQSNEPIRSQIEEDFQADMQDDETAQEWKAEKHKNKGDAKKTKGSDRREEMESKLESQVDKHVGEGMEQSKPIQKSATQESKMKSQQQNNEENKPGSLSEEKIRERLKEDRNELP